MAKPYEKPRVESESAFEALATYCGLLDPNDDTNCDPEWGGTIYSVGAP
jgi:hypothetical protein